LPKPSAFEPPKPKGDPPPYGAPRRGTAPGGMGTSGTIFVVTYPVYPPGYRPVPYPPSKKYSVCHFKSIKKRVSTYN
jgi:hypothetical protein